MIERRALGIEIAPDRLRVLRLRRGGGSAEAMEVDWNAATPAESVTALRERFGTGARIAVALDASALFMKRLALPTLPVAERRKMIALDPERYFPVRDEPLVVGVGPDGLVVAARAAPFDRAINALATLGGIERVEPAPAALARHLAASGTFEAVVVMAHPQAPDWTLLSTHEHGVLSVRKLPADPREIAVAVAGASDGGTPRFLYPWTEELADALARNGVSVKPVPAPRGSTETFAGARGALLGIDEADGLTLTSPGLQRAQRARARRRGIMAVAALAVALTGALWSLDARRVRMLAELQRRLAAQQDRVVQAERLQADVAATRQEIHTLSTVSRERPDPLAALLLITKLLPPDAHVRALHATGDAWELDGEARDAASLVPTFAASNALTDVRFRSATTRAQVGDQSYETFSLALRYTHPSH